MNMTWSLMQHFHTCVQEFENPQLLKREYMEYSLCGIHGMGVWTYASGPDSIQTLVQMAFLHLSDVNILSEPKSLD